MQLFSLILLSINFLSIIKPVSDLEELKFREYFSLNKRWENPNTFRNSSISSMLEFTVKNKINWLSNLEISET